MKMRSGPKAFLGLALAGGLVGFGFWAGRGFPRTWEGVFQQPSAAGASPASLLSSRRIDAMEVRIDRLEQEVVALQAEIRTSRLNPAPASLPLDDSNPSPRTSPVPPEPSRDRPATNEPDKVVEYR